MNADVLRFQAWIAVLYEHANVAERGACEEMDKAAHIHDLAVYDLGLAMHDAMLNLRVTLDSFSELPDDPRARLDFSRGAESAWYRLKVCAVELNEAIQARLISKRQSSKASGLHKRDIVVAAAREWIEREGKDSPAKVVKEVLARRLDDATLSPKTLIRFLRNPLRLWPWPKEMDKATALSKILEASSF